MDISHGGGCRCDVRDRVGRTMRRKPDAARGRVATRMRGPRLASRVQLTTAGHKAYLSAVDHAYGDKVDYAMLVKRYGEERAGEARYSPAKCIGAKLVPIKGEPEMEHVSTSYVERSKLTIRMGQRRFTRTPATEAGVTDRLWSIDDLVALIPEPTRAAWGSKWRADWPRTVEARHFKPKFARQTRVDSDAVRRGTCSAPVAGTNRTSDGLLPWQRSYLQRRLDVSIMGAMQALAAARPGVELLYRCAARCFALPPLASSLLPESLKTTADEILRARDEDGLLDVLDAQLAAAGLFDAFAQMPKGGRPQSEQDERGLMLRVLGTEGGAKAGIGVTRFRYLNSVILALFDRRIESETDKTQGSVKAHQASFMDVVCADLPSGLSESLLAIGRALLCWIAIFRADEKGTTVSTGIQMPMARIFADGPYPALRLLASTVPIPDTVVPSQDIVNAAGAFRQWVGAMACSEDKARAAVDTGEYDCETQHGGDGTVVG